jgi:putative N6-adenine-specific DNA methylase
MPSEKTFEIFLATAPGLEATLADEVRLKGFKKPKTVAGGVTFPGAWPDVWRANLWLRGAERVLARIASFHVQHLAELDARARRVPWTQFLRVDQPFRVEAVCKKSKIYHSGAAAERLVNAVQATLGAPFSPEASILIKARFEHDVCTLSLDTSGERLHKRGYKEAVSQAPLRETMAALLLRQCGYDGNEPLLDPMCGSGTFVIEAAEIAAHLNPGRARSFAFEKLATFDAEAWQRMRTVKSQRVPAFPAFGSDRDSDAIAKSRANADRAGVDSFTAFEVCPAQAARPPVDHPGLVIVNPPYGVRLGDKKKLLALYRAFGQTMRDSFTGWRIGLITPDPALARTTALPFLPTGAPIQHGGLRVTLYRTAPLK